MFCPKCGTQLKDDARFCYKCGSSIKPMTSASQQNSNNSGATVQRQPEKMRPSNAMEAPKTRKVQPADPPRVAEKLKAKPKKKNRKIPIIAIIAAVLVLAAAGIGGLWFFNGSGNLFGGADSTKNTVEQTEEEKESAKMETEESEESNEAAEESAMGLETSGEDSEQHWKLMMEEVQQMIDSDQMVLTSEGEKFLQKDGEAMNFANASDLYLHLYRNELIIKKEDEKSQGSEELVQLSESEIAAATQELPTASQELPTVKQELTTTDHEAFYGIWCDAKKSEKDAQASADKMKKSGIDARVFVTTDWSNLNSVKWYVVSAGVYKTESDAENALSGVKKVYADAYVKYSGEWKGTN